MDFIIVLLIFFALMIFSIGAIGMFIFMYLYNKMFEALEDLQDPFTLHDGSDHNWTKPIEK